MIVLKNVFQIKYRILSQLNMMSCFKYTLTERCPWLMKSTDVKDTVIHFNSFIMKFQGNNFRLHFILLSYKINMTLNKQLDHCIAA